MPVHIRGASSNKAALPISSAKTLLKGTVDMMRMLYQLDLKEE